MPAKKTFTARFGLRLLAGYLAVNLLLFFVNPHASPWHYGSQNPAPIDVTTPKDAGLSLDQITRILNSIDLAYEAREPTTTEKLWLTGKQVTQVLFLPSSVALAMQNFSGYLGPANSQQQAFTVSVKKRYNRLAALAITKGMINDGFLFQEEPSLSKKNGRPFASLR